MRWKEGDQPKPPTVYQSSPSATKKPSAPSFINKDTPVPTKKPDFKPPIAMRDVPAYPPAPEQPRKPESFGQVNNEKKVLEEKKSTDFKQQNKDAKQREKPNSTGFKFEKPATPKGPILEQKIQDKIPENKSSDPPWIKKEAKQELIKPSAPPPKPSDNNFPWQKKSEQKNNNEQPPGPTVNI